MPYLEYLSSGTASDIDLYILSIVGFPNDPCRQRDWFDQARNARTEWFLKEHLFAGLPDDLALHERIIAAASGPRLALGSEEKIGIDTAGYRVVGYLLVRVLASRPRGSLNDAITALITGDGRRPTVPGASEATIRRRWKEYRSVAHLAAAIVYHRDLFLANPASMGLRTSYSPIGAGLALAWAESARVAGEQYRAPRARKPLLDDERTWKVPPSLRLPLVQLELPPPGKVTFDP
jgi:hypothetical protein